MKLVVPMLERLYRHRSGFCQNAPPNAGAGDKLATNGSCDFPTVPDKYPVTATFH